MKLHLMILTGIGCRVMHTDTLWVPHSKRHVASSADRDPTKTGFYGYIRPLISQIVIFSTESMGNDTISLSDLVIRATGALPLIRAPPV